MSWPQGAQLFREAWIAGVHQHFPGEPKPGYVTPWADTPQWEREAAGSVYGATCWTAQMYKQFEDPKPGYVADWPELPTWQQETDADIFEAIERADVRGR
ncbi:hypothetical protein AB0D46_12150 [Streptomyces sp. NPDC048383]|uniref:hypothetical protein n=1 Tax=Streptomyces sp. NPDC048383 TaxID=3155386 RepID=UPI0034301FB9